MTFDYIENPIWNLTNLSLTVRPSKSKFQNDPDYESDELHLNFTVKRTPLHYMINSVYPCIILNAVTLSTYFLPFNLQASLSDY